MQKSIFRKVALERLSSPEQLDQMMRVTHRRGWMALGALIALLATAVVWGLFGTISTKVMGQGILLRHGGLGNVVATYTGEITEFHVSAGEIVSEGQLVASLFSSTGAGSSQLRYISSQHSGRIIELVVEEGSFVREGDRLLITEPLDAALEAVIYLSTGEGKRVRSSMDVEISPSTIRPEEFGYMLGRVRSVSPYPLSIQAMTRTLGTTELARQFAPTGQPYEVVVELFRNPQNTSGFEWSSKGPNTTIESGTVCFAKVVVERQRPIHLMIPTIKKNLGLY